MGIWSDKSILTHRPEGVSPESNTSKVAAVNNPREVALYVDRVTEGFSKLIQTIAINKINRC